MLMNGWGMTLLLLLLKGCRTSNRLWVAIERLEMIRCDNRGLKLLIILIFVLHQDLKSRYILFIQWWLRRTLRLLSISENLARTRLLLGFYHLSSWINLKTAYIAVFRDVPGDPLAHQLIRFFQHYGFMFTGCCHIWFLCGTCRDFPLLNQPSRRALF